MNSSTLKIKICGLTRYEDAVLAAESGAWGLGFIFAEKSPRNCSPESVKEIIQRLNEDKIDVEKVGVFLNQPASEVNRVANETGLTYAQLHGNESPEECEKIQVKVLKAIQHLDITEEKALDNYPYWLLMDAQRVGDNWGGTGQTADWNQARIIAESYPLFLAGNLGPDNVVEAIEQVKPMGVDLSSSIEKEHGIKDHDKLKHLFRVLKEAGYAD